MEMLKNEFQWNKVGFSNCKQEVFYIPQFFVHRWRLFLAFRAFVLVYMTVWLFFHAIHPDVQGSFHWHLTNWTEVIQTFYLLIAFISSLYGYLKHKGKMPLLNNLEPRGTLAIFFKLHWLSFNITADLVVAVVILFWSLAAPTLPTAFFREPIVYHLHLVNLILLIFDIFFIAVPVHLLHFIYGIIATIIYLLFTLILHWTGIKSDIYDVLDWEDFPKRAALYSSLGAVLVIFSHLFVFGLYKLRVHIHSKMVLAGDAARKTPLEVDAVDNNVEIASPLAPAVGTITGEGEAKYSDRQIGPNDTSAHEVEHNYSLI